MHPLRCPHCGQDALGVLAKLSLGPLRSRSCRACGQLLSVPWLPYVGIAVLASLLPLAGGLLAISVLGRAPLGWAAAGFFIGAALALVPALWLHYRLVPLKQSALPVIP